MILRIAKHELKRHYRDGRTKALVFTFVGLSIVAMLLSFSDYVSIKKEYADNLEQARRNWVTQAEKDPHDAAHDGTYVIKPFHPFYMLDKGIQQYSGQVVHLGAHERKQSSLNEVKDNTGMFRFGQLTPNFILLYLFPLLLIFLGYNTFVEEKERKTLRLLLAQGVPLRKLITGKWLALMFQMTFLLLLFVLVTGLGFALLNGEYALSFSEWLGFFGVYLMYFIVFINLILLVSTKARSSGLSLTVSLAIWILITLIIPKLSTNLAGRLHPFPTLQTFGDNIVMDQQDGLNGHNFWNGAAEDFRKKTLEEYGVETVEELPIAFSGLLLAEGEKYESEVYTKHFDLLRDQYEKQRNVYRNAGILSPFLPVRFASMALARTDYGFQWHFEDEAEKYRVELNTALNMNIAQNAKGVEGYKADASLWSNVPKFNYEWQPPYRILTDHTIEYAILFLWALGSFAIMLLFSNKIKAA
jgi:ABC-2 type transport system permease protein